MTPPRPEIHALTEAGQAVISCLGVYIPFQWHFPLVLSLYVTWFFNNRLYITTKFDQPGYPIKLGIAISNYSDNGILRTCQYVPKIQGNFLKFLLKIIEYSVKSEFNGDLKSSILKFWNSQIIIFYRVFEYNWKFSKTRNYNLDSECMLTISWWLCCVTYIQCI